ncbi:MAG: tRNA epoxyqueuosine(34) reductase QueG [Thermoanaerobaculia bacterium]|nr:tRNA epoxyqueuosine(34) reductase QueG [Thermoanaerobaculia bacterium]
MDGAEKSRLLKRWAVEEGFHRAGVARLGPAQHGAAFVQWIERGDHARMGYLERRHEERLDPRRLLPGGRSALCVALHYAPGRTTEPEGDLWPGVARYARGDDYHDLMRRRLEAVRSRIERAFPGTASRAYVDTGPVLERDLAAAAGLGAVGKNTNLLHAEAGSWFLLGELLLDLELAPDPPVADLCGRCTRCLEACPTGALPEPYRLDSRRCISYWTIEHRGPVPATVRPLLGGWVFGCDLCQEACPLNDAPAAASDERFELPERRAALDLVGLLRLRREEYLDLFRGSAMKRARLEGLRRNAAVAMGNRGDRRYVGPLAGALADEDPTLRGHAAWALGEIGGAEAAAALEAAAPAESDPEARSEIHSALGRLASAGG